jgi:ApaG protein
VSRAGARSPRRISREAAYEAESEGFIVRVRPTYLPEQSEPEAHRFVWAYSVEIENRSGDPAQLVSRHWIITDAAGRIEEVKGLGVVGEQPTIRPGETYAYASGCPLSTRSGLMVGTYQMIGDGGERFDIAIPVFSLDLPEARRVVN